MKSEEFNRLLNGPLNHPLPMMMINRLAIALSVVVEATGEAGEKALREHCAARDEKDKRNADEYEGRSNSPHYPKGRWTGGQIADDQ